jgi:hypothetical protein
LAKASAEPTENGVSLPIQARKVDEVGFQYSKLIGNRLEEKKTFTCIEFEVETFQCPARRRYGRP